jgi:hypothetical protein
MLSRAWEWVVAIVTSILNQNDMKRANRRRGFDLGQQGYLAYKSRTEFRGNLLWPHRPWAMAGIDGWQSKAAHI